MFNCSKYIYGDSSRRLWQPKGWQMVVVVFINIQCNCYNNNHKGLLPNVSPPLISCWLKIHIILDFLGDLPDIIADGAMQALYGSLEDLSWSANYRTALQSLLTPAKFSQSQNSSQSLLNMHSLLPLTPHPPTSINQYYKTNLQIYVYIKVFYIVKWDIRYHLFLNPEF